MMQRFSAVRGEKILSLDMAALTLYRLFESFNIQIIRGRYQMGENWTLVDTLFERDEYVLDRDNPTLGLV